MEKKIKDFAIGFAEFIQGRDIYLEQKTLEDLFIEYIEINPIKKVLTFELKGSTLIGIIEGQNFQRGIK